MPTRSHRVVFESLESRATPGGVSAAAAGYPTIVFQGKGSGRVTSLTAGADGYHIGANLQGKATKYGAFTGTGQVVVALTGAGTGAANLFAADGAHVTLAFHGSVKLPAKPSRPGTGHFTFNVTGGTNEFAGATGSGRIDGTVSLSTGVMKYTFSGKLKL